MRDCFKSKDLKPWLSALCRQTVTVFTALGIVWSSPLFGRSPHAPTYTKTVPVPLIGKTREWRCIVIHHTGSSKGNEENIQREHLRRGMENGMAYHFLIGNGSSGLGDGAVVEGHRWKHQLQGGHSHQEYLNEHGIGICLVGNFNRSPPTPRQVRVLAQLAFSLQTRFHITDDNIHGHGQFYGEDSDCPGRLFSWSNLWTQINAVYLAQPPAPTFKGMSTSLREGK